MNDPHQFNRQNQRPQPEPYKKETYYYRAEEIELDSYSFLRLIGYGLLAFSLLDYIHIIIPPHFLDPNWEFQTIGAMVEHLAGPLMGMGLVFYRPQGYVGAVEKKFLHFLCWVSLILGILYLLIIPLAVADTWRIYYFNQAQITTQVYQQTQQIQNLQTKIKSARDDELTQIATSLRTNNTTPATSNPQRKIPPSPPYEGGSRGQKGALRNELLTQLSRNSQSLKAQAESIQANQNQQLFKNSVKWILGALIAATIFIWAWRLTEWARVPV